LEAWIAAQRIEHGIETEQRRSERRKLSEKVSLYCFGASEATIFSKRGLREQPDGQNNSKKPERFPAAFKVRNDLLTQGYGIDRAKSSTLLSKSTEAESSADKSPNKKLTSVHSQNSATTEQL